jgi:hypothetical protein
VLISFSCNPYSLQLVPALAILMVALGYFYTFSIRCAVAQPGFINMEGLLKKQMVSILINSNYSTVQGSAGAVGCLPVPRA